MVRLIGWACAAALAAAVMGASPLRAQVGFADRVVASDTMGQAGGGIFAPANALGRPDGRVHTLGIGGFLTLGFDVPIVDGPGADLVVVENAFRSFAAPWMTFAEVCFVEVSTDGMHFARFPAQYTGPQVDPGAFAFVHTGDYAGLGGVAAADVAAEPANLASFGGDGFDLADLIAHPEVVAGRVDLQDVREVRLVDVRTGVDADAAGRPIRDAGAGAADVDGVVALHRQGTVAAGSPRVALVIPPSGAFVLDIEDPDGLADLQFLGASLFGVPVDPTFLFALGQVTAVTPTSFQIVLPGPLPASIPLRMAVTVRDAAGHASSAARTRQG
ncbi:MAG: hypothetical protein ACO3UM_01490 [Planctomycetota bacterium]